MNRVVFKSESVEWPSPQAVYDQLDEEFHFDYDPCPLGGTVDGTSPLFSDWRGRRVYCNPPYGPGIRPFLNRAVEADVAVFLLPAKTDTKWFHELVLPHAKEIRFIKGRLKFGDAKFNAPFPSMIVIYGGSGGNSETPGSRRTEGPHRPDSPLRQQLAGDESSLPPSTHNEATQ